MSKARTLTPKQERFCLHYHEFGNASEAYRSVYSTKNMKAETVNRKAKELLDNGKITARLQELIQPALDRAEVTAEMVVAELKNIAFGNLGDVVEWGPDGVKLKDSKLLTPEQMATICEVSETVTIGGGSMRIKRHDKMKALELLGRHLGLFDKKDDGLDKLKGILEHMEGLGSTLQSPQPQRNIKDFE